MSEDQPQVGDEGWTGPQPSFLKRPVAPLAPVTPVSAQPDAGPAERPARRPRRPEAEAPVDVPESE